MSRRSLLTDKRRSPNEPPGVRDGGHEAQPRRVVALLEKALGDLMGIRVAVWDYPSNREPTMSGESALPHPARTA